MFEQSKLKIKRANHHIADLNVYITDVLKDRLYTLTIEKNPQTGKAGLVCRMCSNETDIPLFVGDVTHNLRSAIDILYCDILRHEGHTIDKNSKWPFRATRAELEGALNGRKPEAALSAEVVDLILNSIQTYRGGNGNALYSLHDLNIEDKHMLLLPTFNISAVAGIEFIEETGAIGSMNCSFYGGGGIGTFFGQGGECRCEAATDIVEIKNHGQATFEVLFGKGDFHGSSVVSTLHQLSQLVSVTVDTVEKVLISSNVR